MEIKEIKITECHAFENYPFKYRSGLEAEMLSDSIKENGILLPITVRPREEGGYEILSGHRRVRACKELGIETIPAIVKEMSRDEAVVLMVDMNIHRDGILPSEKAYAYKMRLEAMKRLPGRSPKNNVVPLGHNSREKLSEQIGESQTQIQRYIRLTYLIKPILDLVDEGRIAIRPAVELSYLQKYTQEKIYEFYESDEITPSYSQAVRLHKLEKDDKLDYDTLCNIMMEEKPNQVECINYYAELCSKPTEAKKKLFALLHNEQKEVDKELNIELKKAKKRLSELDGIFMTLYEDRVNGNITERNYSMMSAKYSNEQNQLQSRIEEIGELIMSKTIVETNIDDFVSGFQNFGKIEQLTARIIHETIEAIYVSEREKTDDGEVTQHIKIVFKHVGELPNDLHIKPTERKCVCKPKICARCGGVFTPLSNVAKYCDACRIEARKQQSIECYLRKAIRRKESK